MEAVSSSTLKIDGLLWMITKSNNYVVRTSSARQKYGDDEIVRNVKK